MRSPPPLADKVTAAPGKLYGGFTLAATNPVYVDGTEADLPDAELGPGALFTHATPRRAGRA
jgi:hypothetical protein